MTTEAEKNVQDGCVRIEINSLMARVSPPHEALLAPLLTCSANGFECGGPLGHQRRRHGVEFYRVENGALWAPVSMVDQIEAVLRRAGLEVQIVRRPELGGSLAVDHELLHRLPDDERQMLQAVLAHPAGLIEVSKPGELAKTVGLVCRLWPTAKILIPVPTRKQTRRLCDQLQPMLGNQVQTIQTWEWNTEHRCLVCTLALGDHCTRQDWDLVLYPDPHAAVVVSHLPILRQFLGRRHYGFLPRGSRLGRGASLRLGSFFGSVIYRAPDPRGQAAKVQVLWLTPPCSPQDASRSAQERKRSRLWHNDVRNDFVAAVARAVDTADPVALAELGCPAEYPFGASNPSKTRVTIVVESTTHGEELVRRLPSWTLCSMTPADRERREREEKQTALGGFFVCLDQKIVTTLMASKLATIDTDVLIRADAGLGPLSAAGFPPRSSLPGKVVTLMDVADDFDSLAVEATRRRQADYAGQGWTVLTAPRWVLDEETAVPGTGEGDDRQRRRRRGA